LEKYRGVLENRREKCYNKGNEIFFRESRAIFPKRPPQKTAEGKERI